MPFSAKTEYACLAMLQLAEDRAEGGPTPQRTLAERQAIPEGFLVQILCDLRRAGLVTSTRGSSGGYRLARSAEEISLAEVVNAIEGEPTTQTSTPCATPLGGVLASVCGALQAAERERLESLSLADMVEQAAGVGEPMWYI